MKLRVVLSRALDLLLRRRREERLSAEIQSHLDYLTEEYAARGMTPADARAAARRAFGGVEQVKEAYRDQRGLPVVDALMQDVRFAMRLLRRDRSFSLTAVLVLAIGIGVNNMLFTILNAHTIRGLPIDGVDRVVYVSTFDDRVPDRGVSYLDYEDIRGGTQRLVRLAAFTSAPFVLAGDSRAAERLEGAFVSEDAFTVLRIEPILGRDFSVEDHRAGAAPVAILGGGTWASRYGADAGILGRSILINGTPATVIGVIPERSGFPSSADVWLPLSQVPGLAAQKRGERTLRVIGRLHDGITVAEARTAIESIAGRLSREHADTNRNVRARVVPINERFLGRVTDPAWLAFMTAGCLVVLISSANAANLMLASSVRRTREIAIRTSLGASRRRIVRQLMIEGVVLAAVGGLAGLGLAMAGVRLFRSAIPENVLPYWLDYSLDARVFAALVAVSLGTVVVFALMPAVHASKADVTGVLKDETGGGTGRRATQRWATAFLAAEFGLAVVLLAHITMSWRNDEPSSPDDVIHSREIVTAVVTLPSEAYRSPEERTEFYRRLYERLGGNPRISVVSASSVLPIQSGPEETLDVEGRPLSQGADKPTARTVLIAPRYFEALGFTLARGRDFTTKDGSPGHAHAIVNQRLVQRFFAGQDPIGQRLAVTPPGAVTAAPNWLTIVGIAPNIRGGRAQDEDPIVYVPFRSAPPVTATLFVRAGGGTGGAAAGTLAPLLRQEVQAIDANLPLYRIRTLAQAARDAQWNGRLAAALILTLTLIAMALSTIGLYAVTSYGISQRAHEIGLRMALGARPYHVAAVISRRVLAQLAAGFVVGVICTMLWDRTLSSGVAGVALADPRSLVIVAGILIGVAAIACFVPIRQALRLDPLAAIRRL